MEDYDKNKESSYLNYWDVNNFEWIEDILSLMKISQKVIMKKVIKDIFSKLTLNIVKNYMAFIMIYYFYQKE